jgi:hypothetical protein
MRLLTIALFFASAADAQTENTDATENLISVLSRSMDNETPAYFRIGNSICWEARIEVVDGDLIFGGGQGPAPRIFADQAGPMLFLDGSSDQIRGKSYMVLRAQEATVYPSGAILRPVSLCREVDGAPQCTRNIGGLGQFSLEVSSENFCD